MNEDRHDLADFLGRARRQRGDSAVPFYERDRWGRPRKREYESLDLRSVDLGGACLRGVRLIDCNLSNASLERADTRGTEVVRCDLSQTTLRSSHGYIKVISCFGADGDWRDAGLGWMTMVDTILTRFDLSGAVLRRARFTRTTLDRCQFSGVDLIRACFSECAVVEPMGWPVVPDDVVVDDATVRASSATVFRP